jgi:DNA modification methylase
LFTLLEGDCVERMRDLPDGSVDAICTDPPYSISFMQRGWDRHASPAEFQAWCSEWGAEALRVLKPGGHLLAFGGTRTYHRLTCGLEDAGFVIRDCLMYAYGAGFPKSMKAGCQCADGEGDLPGVQHDVHGLSGQAPQSRGAEVLTEVQWGAQGRGVGEARVEGPGGADDAVQAALRASEPSVEGRGDLQEASRESPRGEVRPMPGVGAPDGPEGRVCDGASAGDGGLDWQDVDAHGGRASSEPRSAGQSPREFGVVADERGPQAGGGWEVCPRCGLPMAELGTALKPAFEPIVMARKPLIGTVAANVATHGTGALNIGECRISTSDDLNGGAYSEDRKPSDSEWVAHGGTIHSFAGREYEQPSGRWPANVMLGHHDDCERVGEREVRNRSGSVTGDESSLPTAVVYGARERVPFDAPATVVVEQWECHPDCPVALLDAQSGVSKSSGGQASLGAFRNGDIYGKGRDERESRDPGLGDVGGASRFFYSAKSSSAERNAGLSDLPVRERPNDSSWIPKCSACGKVLRSDMKVSECCGAEREWAKPTARQNTHPTVKPIDVMRWLCRLVTPPGGVVLDPFMGSGTTGIAAILEGFQFVGIEKDVDYMPLAQARIEWWSLHPTSLPVERALAAEAKRQKVAESGQGTLL